MQAIGGAGQSCDVSLCLLYVDSPRCVVPPVTSAASMPLARS